MRRTTTKRKPRQIWINGTEKACQHESTETLMTMGGTPLADICTFCQMKIAEYGTCDGCDTHKRLVKWGKNGVRWCGGTCQTKWEALDRIRKRTAPKQPYLQRNATGHTE